MKVYFDMDGVLADFAGGFREMCGKDAPVQGTSADDEVYDAIRSTPHFYRRLKPYDDMLQLFRKLRDTGNVDCIILTGLPKPYRGIEDAEPDKRGWVDEYLGPDTEFIAVDRRHKADYAEGNILIDDYPPNIEEWEAAGGRGVLPDDLRGKNEWDILRILIDHKISCFMGGGKIVGARLLNRGSGYCGCIPGRCYQTSLSVNAAGTVVLYQWIWDEDWEHHTVRRSRKIPAEKAKGAIAKMTRIALSHDLFVQVCDGSDWQLTIRRDDGKKLDIAGFSHTCPKGTERKISELAESVGFPGCWLF